MTGKQKFLSCGKCGSLIGVVKDIGIKPICCGEKMAELVPNTVEASHEKHLPVVEVKGDSINVQVGSALHPMEDAHNIMYVYVETQHGGQRKSLNAGEEPKLTFTFSNDKPVAVYAYCNLHGLWKTDI